MTRTTTRLTLACAAFTVAVASGLPARAQSVKDPQLTALLDARKYAEAERVATARITARPDDMDAYAALTVAVTNDADAARRESALKRLEVCTVALPDAAMCHFGVGAVLGVNALSQGMVAGLRSVGRIRESFVKALEIDPLFYAARSSLVQFYLTVPGIAGGSVSKARDVANAASGKQPEHAKLLLGMVALEQKDYAQAERAVASVRVGSDKELAGDVQAFWPQLGIAYLADKQVGKARAVFERAVQEAPQQAIGHYGVGRALAEAGELDAAIAAYQRAVAFEGAAALPIDYRLGMAWQAKGERDKARAAFTRFIGAGKGNPKNLDDAKKRLAELA